MSLMIMTTMLMANKLEKYHEAALTTDGVRRLCDVSSMQKVVIRVAELAVSELQLGKKVLQHLIVDLPHQEHHVRLYFFSRYTSQLLYLKIWLPGGQKRALTVASLQHTRETLELDA